MSAFARRLLPSQFSLTLGRDRSMRTVSNAVAIVAMLVRVAVAALVLGATAAVAQKPALSQKSNDASELLARIQQDGSVRVIVLFDSPVPPSQVTPEPANVAAVKTRVASMQDSILSMHFGSPTPPASQGIERGLTRFEITPGFALSVNGA